MPPTSPGSANYYLALNGVPNGPHRAASVLDLLRQGTIQPDTLVCSEGGAAWVPVSEMESALRLEAMPVPPSPPLPASPPSLHSPAPPPSPAPAPSPVSPPLSVRGQSLTAPQAGYQSGASVSPARFRPEPIAPVSRVPLDPTKPIRFATLLGALALFFLPWVELRCASVKTIRQSGVQTIVSRYSLDEDMLSVMELGGGPAVNKDQFAQLESDAAKKHFSEKVGYSWFAGGALLCVVIGLGAALGATGRQTAGVMALLALICLGVQMISGFPLQREFESQMKEVGKYQPSDPGAGAAMQMMMGNSKFVSVDYSPWFYTELGLLGLTVIIGFTGGTRRQS